MNNSRIRKEDKLLKKFSACKKKQCSKTRKIQSKLENSFEKEQSKACSQKSNWKFYLCSKKFYNKSEKKKVNDNLRDCSEKKCAKERKNLSNFREKSQEDVFDFF